MMIMNNAMPRYLLHIWNDGNQNLTMEELTGNSVGYWKKFYEYHKLIQGHTAQVWCFFSDYDIRDSEIKHMATCFMKGNYYLITVDLYDGKVTRQKGISRVNPRQ